MRTREFRRLWVLVLSLVAGGMLPACSGSTGTGDADSVIPQKYAAFAAAFDKERRQMGVSGASVALIENGNADVRAWLRDQGAEQPGPRRREYTVSHRLDDEGAHGDGAAGSRA